ncbi:C-type lectin lectoxin-Lio2-like [Mizuhopecten yessoensis]|uniref:C-type lectin lectoxin-Lio2-like n=1 Tax=Mizuhopecten yessoensis TaxID=6573 RepID=UPI000B45AA18|nr:C-type lectin lectoxin-Lio2-like [Mizuhopecten yessoensis]
MENWFPLGDVTSVGVVRSKSECGLHCSAVGWCMSIIYDSANNTCYLNDVLFTDVSNGYWRQNTTHFQVKSTVTVPEGNDCNAFTGICINLLSSLHNWNDAFDACAAKGERFLLIDSADKQLEAEQFMQDQGLSSLWIGLTDQVTEGVWLDGEGNIMEYSSFAYGQPDNGGSNQHCALMRANYGYKWDDFICSHKTYVVCEMILAM